MHHPIPGIFSQGNGNGQGYGDDFVMVFRTTTAAETLRIPCRNVGTFNAVIDWGDDSTSDITAYNDADLAHVYADADTYTVSISGTFPNIYFVNSGDKNKLKQILNWGNTGFTRLNFAFYGCGFLTSVTSESANTSSVTDMYGMFLSCGLLTTLDVSGFDTSAVTDMGNMFKSCGLLTTLDVSGFDTSAVTIMAAMFNLCTDLTALDVSGFNTALVTNMGSMFKQCSTLTALDVSGFNTALVTDMATMFATCTNLTALDVSGFNTAAVRNMTFMFQNLPALTDAAIDGWNIEAVTNLTSFMSGTTFPTARYDATLIAWDAQNPVDSLSVHFGGSKYTPAGAAETARTSLITGDLWSITDGGAV